MKILRWSIIFIAIAVILSVTIWYFVADNSSSKTASTSTEIKTIKLNEVTHSVFYSPQYVAMALGYFEEEGLKIDLTTGQGADNVMTAVLTGDADIGFAGPEASIYVYNEGKTNHTQVFAQLTKRDGAFLVSREKNDNFTWNDVKGKTIIPGRKGGVPYMALEYALKSKNINPNTDVVLDDSIKFDLMAGAFTAGTADYVTLFEPTASMTEKAGAGYIVASVGETAGEIPYTAYFATKNYINSNEDIIQKFTNAIYKGQKWVANHTATEITDKIISYFPDTDREILISSIQRYKDIDVWQTDPVLSEALFNKLQDVIEEAGELAKRADYSAVVNNKYAEEAIKNIK